MGAAALAPVAASDHQSGDTTGPEIEIETPGNGAEYEQGSKLRADFECRDESGVRLCIGTVADGERISTDKLGEFGFRVVGLDRRGNWSSLTHSYRIVEEVEPPRDPPDEEPPPDDPPDEEPPDDPPESGPPAGEEPPPDPPAAAQQVVAPPTAAPPTASTPPAAARGPKLPAPRLRHASSMRPRAGARLSGLQPRLRWRQVKGATLYNVQVFEWRGKKWVKVRSLFPRRASVRPGRALRAGRRHAWQVWPWRNGRYDRAAVRVSYFDTPAKRASRLLSPRSSRVREGRPLVVRWKRAPGNGAYTVRVAGASTFRMRTTKTTARIPARVVKRGSIRLSVTRGSGGSVKPWVTRRLSAR